MREQDAGRVLRVDVDLDGDAVAAVADVDGRRLAKLKQLGELHASGVLSDEEFAAAKAKLLS